MYVLKKVPTMTATEEFISKFHSLDGITIGEKRKNLFLLLNSTDNDDAIDFSQLMPQNFLEEKFKVDVLLHFKRVSDLIDVMKCGKPLQSERAIKRSSWFVQQLVNTTNAEELVMNIFPYVSFRTKVKVINKLAIYLNDANVAQTYFNAIEKRYGAYLAGKLLPSCHSDFIISFLQKQHFKPNVKQVLTIIKRYPHATEDVINIIMRFDDATEVYQSIFNYLKKNNTDLFIKLNEEYHLCLQLGWRLTRKYVHQHQDDVIKDPNKYYKILHNRQIAKTLYLNYGMLYKNFFPQNLQSFPNEYNLIFSVLNNLPKKMRQADLLVGTFQKLYQSSFWSHSYITEELLVLLTPLERANVIQCANKPQKISEERWKSYLTTDKSVPYLKKNISLTSKISMRAVLVDCLVMTCKVNLDYAALLDVSKYMLETHRNDSIKVRKSFLSSLAKNFDLETLSEEHWKYINDFISILELNDEKYEQIRHFKKGYIQYRLLQNLPVEEQLTKWVLHGYENLQFSSDAESQRHCLVLLEIIINNHFKGEDLHKWNSLLLSAVICLNNHSKDKVSLFAYKNATQSFKEIVITDYFNHNYITVLSNFIKEEKGKGAMLDIYLNLSSVHRNTDILLWLIKNHPLVIAKHVRKVTLISLNSDQYNIFKYMKNYPQILNEAIKICLLKKEDIVAITALSHLQTAEDFLKIVKEYYPSDKQADSKTQAGCQLYNLQVVLTNSLVNLDEPSATMSSILKFCKGDYLKLVRKALYSASDNVNEIQLVPFFAELIDQAVSVRKHALHLTFRVLDKNEIYTLLKHFMEKERNCSIRKFIFKACFNFFAKNPEPFTWELVTLNLNAVDINDKEAVEILMQFEIVPRDYKIKYVILTWNLLHKVPDPDGNQMSNKGVLLNSISAELIPLLPKEFCENVIDAYFFKQGPSEHLTFFISNINTFVCKYILYSTEAEERLNSCFTVVKEFMAKSWNDLDDLQSCSCSQNTVDDFLKEFCLPFLKDECSNSDIFYKFCGLWDAFTESYETFEEDLHLKLTSFYLDSLDTLDLALKIKKLCESLVDTYGNIVVNMMYNKVDRFLPYFFKNKKKNVYDFFENLLENSISCLLLVILLLGKNAPIEVEDKLKYKKIVAKLETESNPTVQLYLCNLLSGNAAVCCK
ncbi:hypothetical protein FQA39_LY17371 [Lamprigera yunnana]|nr:hypothetical protein FQA39_LY17371 [Lamprigera yunnana]